MNLQKLEKYGMYNISVKATDGTLLHWNKTLGVKIIYEKCEFFVDTTNTPELQKEIDAVAEEINGLPSSLFQEWVYCGNT